MGIVNVTPDSFSDGGRYHDSSEAVEHALQLVEEGADLIDVGGESTRPYAQPVPLSEELDRVIPVVESVCRKTAVPVSIDTVKAAVAADAVRVGAQIINDVSGATADANMVSVIAETGAGVCLMHMQGTPRTMQDAPSYGNVTDDVLVYLGERRDALTAAGVAADRICLDPGIGFGKRHQHNVTLLRNCARFHSLGRPLLIGHSRKSTIGWVLGDQQADRTAGTVGVALALARQGVQIIRLHDVRPVHEALQLFQAVGGCEGVWPDPKRR
ncbi:MAG: dihydropteroate synthase [Pirellulales bacterium]